MTRFNNKYPYTDFHELNADWLLETVKDAAAEAQEASDTVATYNDRLTTVEGDLAPIKAAMPGLASDVSGLKHDVGVMDSLITDTINPGLDTLKNEVETPTTGLLDRVTTLKGKVDEHDNDINNIEGRMVTYDHNFIDINNQFISDQGRIRDLETYRTEAQVKIGNLGYSIAPLFDETAGYNAGDYVMSPTLKLHRARVNIMPGTANIDDLTQFMPTDINNALDESALPSVTSANAGDVLTVDNSGNWTAAAPSGGVDKIVYFKQVNGQGNYDITKGVYLVTCKMIAAGGSDTGAASIIYANSKSEGVADFTLATSTTMTIEGLVYKTGPQDPGVMRIRITPAASNPPQCIIYVTILKLA